MKAQVVMKNLNRSHLKTGGGGGWGGSYTPHDDYCLRLLNEIHRNFPSTVNVYNVKRFLSHWQVSPVSSSQTAAWAKHARRPFDVRMSWSTPARGGWNARGLKSNWKTTKRTRATTIFPRHSTVRPVVNARPPLFPSFPPRLPVFVLTATRHRRRRRPITSRRRSAAISALSQQGKSWK